MALGSNLSAAGSQKRRWSALNQLLGDKRFTRMKRSFGDNIRIVSTTTTPADNTANDNPGRKGTIIVKYTSGAPSAAYVCTSYTSSSSFALKSLTS